MLHSPAWLGNLRLVSSALYSINFCGSWDIVTCALIPSIAIECRIWCVMISATVRFAISGHKRTPQSGWWFVSKREWASATTATAKVGGMSICLISPEIRGHPNSTTRYASSHPTFIRTSQRLWPCSDSCSPLLLNLSSTTVLR